MQNFSKTETPFGKLLCKSKALNQQLVRYTQKSRWVPTKMFGVAVRPQISTEEGNELFHLFTIYGTSMKSILKQLEREVVT